ncbi:helix-turn-helix domain-containing protein [Saliphagus infecundisoli]|uniref:Helix-turn-helix domain-containing protein n=1 Tax=Saliphagus infecundisoli TaxID=1849069 RepID=A0ABD5QGI3_9EURY|nr:helix-turn-helix domain-containing protein [Saliphagus infecundisoli]
MVDAGSSDSPLEEVSAGAYATEAFELLGNETRLAILVALWEEYDPFGEVTVRFSELRDRVGTADSGQFNYHLDRLEDHFVRATDGGYELSQAGLKLVRSVIAGTGLEEPTLESTAVDMACKLCGEPVAVAYEDGWVYVRCTECAGLWTDAGDRSRGHLAKFSLDPAGLANRSAGEIYAAAWVHSYQRIYGMLEEVCPTCSGPVERSLAICEDHESGGPCRNCDRHLRIVARLRCTVCKELAQAPLGTVAKYHPAVVAFCDEHGLELQYGFNDLDHIARRLEVGGSAVEQVSEEPPRVRVTTAIDGDEVALELDDGLNVVAVE